VCSTVRNAEFPHHQGQPGHIRNGTCIPDAIAAQEELDVYTPTGNARYDSAVLAAMQESDPKERSYKLRALDDEAGWWKGKQR